ncbi:MAG: hypothetical protein GY795_51405 [Desulfobacterales bacterium]|nr:hypothetical protein [Desulfobacterales bacterium]
MQTYQAKKVIPENGIIVLDSLPFAPKDTVEIIVRLRESEKSRKKRYPLHGKVLSYEDPTKPVAQDDWDVLK